MITLEIKYETGPVPCVVFNRDLDRTLTEFAKAGIEVIKTDEVAGGKYITFVYVARENKPAASAIMRLTTDLLFQEKEIRRLYTEILTR